MWQEKVRILLENYQQLTHELHIINKNLTESSSELELGRRLEEDEFIKELNRRRGELNVLYGKLQKIIKIFSDDRNNLHNDLKNILDNKEIISNEEKYAKQKDKKINDIRLEREAVLFAMEDQNFDKVAHAEYVDIEIKKVLDEYHRNYEKLHNNISFKIEKQYLDKAVYEKRQSINVLKSSIVTSRITSHDNIERTVEGYGFSRDDKSIQNEEDLVAYREKERILDAALENLSAFCQNEIRKTDSALQYFRRKEQVSDELESIKSKLRAAIDFRAQVLEDNDCDAESRQGNFPDVRMDLLIKITKIFSSESKVVNTIDDLLDKQFEINRRLNISLIEDAVGVDKSVVSVIERKAIINQGLAKNKKHLKVQQTKLSEYQEGIKQCEEYYRYVCANRIDNEYIIAKDKLLKVNSYHDLLSKWTKGTKRNIKAYEQELEYLEDQTANHTAVTIIAEYLYSNDEIADHDSVEDKPSSPGNDIAINAIAVIDDENIAADSERAKHLLNEYIKLDESERVALPRAIKKKENTIKSLQAKKFSHLDELERLNKMITTAEDNKRSYAKGGHKNIQYINNENKRVQGLSKRRHKVQEVNIKIENEIKKLRDEINQLLDEVSEKTKKIKEVESILKNNNLKIIYVNGNETIVSIEDDVFDEKARESSEDDDQAKSEEVIDSINEADYKNTDVIEASDNDLLEIEQLRIKLSTDYLDADSVDFGDYEFFCYIQNSIYSSLSKNNYGIMLAQQLSKHNVVHFLTSYLEAHVSFFQKMVQGTDKVLPTWMSVFLRFKSRMFNFISYFIAESDELHSSLEHSKRQLNTIDEELHGKLRRQSGNNGGMHKLKKMLIMKKDISNNYNYLEKAMIIATRVMLVEESNAIDEKENIQKDDDKQLLVDGREIVKRIMRLLNLWNNLDTYINSEFEKLNSSTIRSHSFPYELLDLVEQFFYNLDSNLVKLICVIKEEGFLNKLSEMLISVLERHINFLHTLSMTDEKNYSCKKVCAYVSFRLMSMVKVMQSNEQLKKLDRKIKGELPTLYQDIESFDCFEIDTDVRNLLKYNRDSLSEDDDFVELKTEEDSIAIDDSVYRQDERPVINTAD